jgi:hypothetical protein
MAASFIRSSHRQQLTATTARSSLPRCNNVLYVRGVPEEDE